jgi:hypothetical protein
MHQTARFSESSTQTGPPASRATAAQFWDPKGRSVLYAGLLAIAALTTPRLAAQTTVVAWGLDYDSGSTNVPIDLTNAVAIAAADSISMAVKADGTVAAWGDGLSQVPPNVTNIVSISTGLDFALASRQDGSVTAWGTTGIATLTNVPPGLGDVVAVRAGLLIAFALKGDSTIAAWGQTNFNGTLVIEPGLSNIVQIAADHYGGVALKADGTVSVLSFESPAPIPGLSNVVAISAEPGLGNVLALRSDGTVTGWTTLSLGYRAVLPDAIPTDLTNIVAVSAGTFGAMAIARDGTLHTWRLQPPATTNEPWLTIPVAAQSNVIAIAAARTHNVALIGHATWPWITQQPQNVLTNDGATVRFRVVGVASAPLSYQWQLNGRNLTGATADTLTIQKAGAVNAGFYSVLVSAGTQTIRSQPASLTIVPVIAARPIGGRVTLSWPLSGKDYWLEQATPTNLSFQTAFENVQQFPPQGEMEATLSNSPPARLFRLAHP